MTGKIMVDVANEAGVSITTVSHVINQTRYVKKETRDKVLQSMKKLNYQPNALARSLRKKSTNTIGIVISDINNNFFTEIVRACEDNAYKNGYNIILCNTDEDPAKEELYINILLSKQVDGIIISPTCCNTEYMGRLISSRKPVVFIDRFIEGLEVDFVGINNVRATYDAVNHLVKMGHKRIALVSSKENLSSISERIEGYKQAILKNMLEYDEDLFIHIDGGESKPEEVRKKMVDFLKNNELPDCILSLNNIMTLGVVSALKDTGLKCPEDVAIMGIGDFYWAGSFEPNITAMKLPAYEIGYKATKILLSKIKKSNKNITSNKLPAQLIVRSSCGSGKSSKVS